MRLDRYKVKQRMATLHIDHFKELAEKADIGENTMYNALDSHNWRSTTIVSIAKALGCNPLELITIDYDNQN